MMKRGLCWIAKTATCAMFCACGAAAPLHSISAPSPAMSERTSQSLEARTRAFLEAVSRHDRHHAASFFPDSGEFTYLHTVHGAQGDQTTELRFPAREATDLIETGQLWTSFDVQVEDQPIGLLAHQVRYRGVRWKRVSETRFVPPDADATSAIFVEWRREGSQWVVSSFGDERFTADPLPSWCC